MADVDQRDPWLRDVTVETGNEPIVLHMRPGDHVRVEYPQQGEPTADYDAPPGPFTLTFIGAPLDGRSAINGWAIDGTATPAMVRDILATMTLAERAVFVEYARAVTAAHDRNTAEGTYDRDDD